jgi:hypothetical protein
MDSIGWDRASDRVNEWLSDRRKRKLRWGLGYPLVTVVPLWAVGAFDPVLSAALLVVVTVPAGIFMGIMGEDIRAETASSQWRSSGHNEGLPTLGGNDVQVDSGKLIDYTTGVTVLGLAGLLGLTKLAFGL